MGNRVVHGDHKVDDKFEKLLLAVDVATSELIKYYNSKTDEGAFVWRNLEFGDHERLIDLGNKFIQNASSPYEEKFRQSEIRRRDIVFMSFKEFMDKWGVTVGMIFVRKFNALKAKYSNTRTQYNDYVSEMQQQ